MSPVRFVFHAFKMCFCIKYLKVCVWAYIHTYIYKIMCLYEHVSWIDLLWFGLEIAIMCSQIAYYICPVYNFSSKFVTVCSVPSVCEHALSLQRIQIFACGNKLIWFCVLSTILMKIQIVTYIYGTLQLLDF